MFNIDKSGKGLGFDLGGNKVCVSYEGASNINVSAGTFYTWAEGYEDAKGDPDTLGKIATLNKYYKFAMEPRYSWDEDAKVEVSAKNPENGEVQTYEIDKQYKVLHDIIHGLEEFKDFETVTSLESLPSGYNSESYRALK
jgi:hypothetical protein